MILDAKNAAERAINILQAASTAARNEGSGLDAKTTTMLSLLDTLLRSEALVSALKDGGRILQAADEFHGDVLPSYEEGACAGSSSSLSESSMITESQPLSPPHSPSLPRSADQGVLDNGAQSDSSPASSPISGGIPLAGSSKDPARKWYAVFVGTQTGVVQGVDTAQSWVHGVSGMSWKSFKSRGEAERAYQVAVERNKVHRIVL